MTMKLADVAVGIKQMAELLKTTVSAVAEHRVVGGWQTLRDA